MSPSLIVLLAACGSDSVADPRAHVVQVTGIQAAPEAVFCGGRSLPYEFTVYISMANTTAHDVTLTAVSSRAYFSAGGPDIVGKPAPALTRPSVPFTPLFLRKGDGAQQTVLRFTGDCPGSSAYGAMDVSFLMTTDRGVYATPTVKMAIGF